MNFMNFSMRTFEHPNFTSKNKCGPHKFYIHTRALSFFRRLYMHVREEMRAKINSLFPLWRSLWCAKEECASFATLYAIKYSKNIHSSGNDVALYCM